MHIITMVGNIIKFNGQNYWNAISLGKYDIAQKDNLTINREL